MEACDTRCNGAPRRRHAFGSVLHTEACKFLVQPAGRESEKEGHVARREEEALRAESWAVSSSVLPLILTRMDDNTRLSGRCTKEEVEFYMRFTLAKVAADRDPPTGAVWICLRSATTSCGARICSPCSGHGASSPTRCFYAYCKISQRYVCL